MTRHVVVVGYGMAGARFAEEVRRRDPDAGRVRLTVLGAEPYRAYNRVLLSSALAGGLDLAAVETHGPDWARTSRVDVRTGTAVAAIDRARRRVWLGDGTAVGYEGLVLATGSRPWLPPIDGLASPDGGLAAGVSVFRELDDCRRIRELVEPGDAVAVLGGGLLGLEAARGLAATGCRVTVVHPVGHLMERQLDAAAGGVLRDGMAGLGVTVRLNATAARWIPGRGLALDDGSRLDCAAVVVAAGVRPATALADRSGLAVDRGVVVDDRLATSDPRVYAVGDCAQHRGVVGGLVQPAWEQAAVLADLLTGADPSARYGGTRPVTRLKAADLDLASAGDAHAEDDGTTEAVRVEDPRRGRYAKLVLRDDRVVGAIMLGLPDAAATVLRLFDTGDPAPADRLALLLGRAFPAGDASPAEPAETDVVCRCNTVTVGAIRRAWHAGARSTTGLAAATRATTGCGGCHRDLETVVHRLADAERTATEGEVA
ncbi:MAG: NAD(P)/FAD-dependent oxidoreductase [Streptosporangiales bacterium]|nr:NAD(P)/FAD-dependent oxidoreductase [Streptosporangiales bacterium]